MEAPVGRSPERSKSPENQPPLTPIHNRTLPGSCHAQNRGTLTWGRGGLLAYGAHSLVVVVDPATVQVLQCLNKHKATVVQVVWSNNDARPLQLASADLTGHIYVWNINSGEVLAQLQDGNQPIQRMCWLSETQEACNDLLLAVHPPNHVILWNTATGAKVWKKQYSETIMGFDLDPFDRSKIIFRCQDCFLFVSDFHHVKKPQSEGKKFYVMCGKGASPIREDSGNSNNEKNNGTMRGARGTKLRKMVRQVVMGEGRGALNASEKGELANCTAVLHHQAQPNIVLAVFPKEVLILDTEIGQTVGMINLERANSSLAQLTSCQQSDVLYLLHESGSVSVWVKRKHYTVVGTPAMSRSVSITFTSTPSEVPNIKDVQPAKDTDVLLEVSYESKAQSEHVRLGKNCRVLGLAVNPVSEMTSAFVTTDGRIFILSLRPSRSKTSCQICPTPFIDQHLLSSLIPSDSADPPVPLKLCITSILGGVAPPDLIIRMCPPLTIRNWTEYKPLMVAGTPSGNVQVYNMSTGVVIREITVHTGQVRGVEWTSSNPAHTIISFAHQSVTGSTLVRNELIHTDIRTGKTKSLRTDRSEEPPIDMIKVSHLKQYFVIAFVGAPFELWDLRKLCLLRTMPKKFPPITALEWSPLHNFKSTKKKFSADSSSEKNDDESTPPSTNRDSTPGKDESSTAIPISPSLNSLVNVKEHIVLTDPDGQLYHFSVEGNSIKDGTKIPAESGMGTVSIICWKSDLIIRGDSEGNINIWNVKTRQSKNINTGNGAIRRMRFSPGKQNMKLLVLHAECVGIWDVKELELINDLRSPRDIGKIVDIEWAASDRAVLACQDGALRMMGLALSGCTSPAFAYNRPQQVSCPGLLPQKQFQNFSALLAHQPWKPQYSLNFTEEDGFTSDQLQFVLSQVDLMPEATKEKLLNPSTSPAQRCFLAANILGLCYDSLFWEVVCWAMDPSSRSLAHSHDILVDSATYLQRQTDKCKLHLNRCADRKSRLAVTSQLLCLQQLDPAVNLLLETEPDDPQYLSDQLLACLVSMTTYTEGAPLSTTKMVATNLIAEGRLWEGVQLLCLTGKVGDACTYLRSSGHWGPALWLAKCRLGKKEYADIVSKYCDHCVTQGRIQEAALMYLSVEDWLGCVETLHIGQYCVLAAQLLDVCPDLGKEDRVVVLTEAVWMEAAKYMAEVSNMEAAREYCRRAGDKGGELRKELEMIGKRNICEVEE